MQSLAPIRHGYLAAALFDTGQLGAPASSLHWQRLYTYVDAAAIRSTDPCFCIERAAWRRCGVTKGGLIVLERLPHISSEGGV